MPWFKVDDNLAFHHKVVAAGNPAMGLWVRAGALCAQQLTDGFIPDHMITALDGRRHAHRLVEVGLWRIVEGGYEFHEWTDRQPTRESVEADREAARQRMSARRASRRSSGERSGEVRANTTRSSGGVREPRPDPTRPTTEANASVSRAERSETPDRFDEFWDAYDKRTGRKAAEQKYRLALRKPGVTPDLLIAAAGSYIDYQKREGKHPEFTKNPATWLNGEHWNDERTARTQPQTRIGAHMALVEQLADEQHPRAIGDGR